MAVAPGRLPRALDPGQKAGGDEPDPGREIAGRGDAGGLSVGGQAGGPRRGQDRRDHGAGAGREKDEPGQVPRPQTRGDGHVRMHLLTGVAARRTVASHSRGRRDIEACPDARRAPTA
jgi:hypothetical protein